MKSKMLVVDDDMLNRVLLSTNLEEAGYLVSTAENGEQALEMLRDLKFDTVFLDLMMPVMNGYEVLEHMKSDKELRKIPVIVISAEEDMDSVVRCIELGATDLLIKPFNPVILHARINASLSSKRLLDQEEAHRREIEEYNLHLEETVTQKIRELRKSMEEQMALQKELHEKEKERMAFEKASQMKSEFIAYVSHELRSPLTVIKGAAATMLYDTEGTLDREVRAEFYDSIESEADRLLVLINEFLDSSRLEAGCPLQINRRETSIETILKSISRMMKNYKYFTEAHRFEFELAEPLPRLNVDQDKITQVISNLVTNAIKYSPEGGAIKLGAAVKNGNMLITVSDEGLGMDHEQLSRLFGRYERLEREEIKQISGTGLGLYLAKTMVDLHGGRIWAESTKGKGSSFFLELPL
ncbi:MAG: response regulator [bacterium]